MERAVVYLEQALLSLNGALEIYFRKALTFFVRIRERKERVKAHVRQREERTVLLLFDRRLLEGELLTIPNMFSFSRIMLGLVLLPMIVYAVPAWITLPVFLIAALTDRLDGVWARLEGETKLGAFLDPMCDKAFFLACLIAFYGIVSTGIFWTLVLLESMSFAIASLVVSRRFRARRGKEVDIRANVFGKMKFSFECIGVGALLLRQIAFGNAILIAAVCLALVSIVRKAEQIVRA